MVDLAGRRVLVTGAAGFIGIPTVRRLLSQGASVVAIDNFAVGSSERLAAQVDHGDLEVRRVDLRDREATLAAMQRLDTPFVIHLAAHHFIPFCIAHPAETIAVNVGGTQHLLDGLEPAGVERLVFASTADVYRPSEAPHREDDPVEPNNVYGASKRMGEWLVRFKQQASPGLDVRVARLFNAYGPGETNPHVLPDILGHMRRGDELPLGNVEPKRDYTFVEDMASLLCALVASDDAANATVNLGAGHARSVTELVDRLRAVSGRPLQIKTDPDKVRRSDRPLLEADTTIRRRLMPDVAITDIDDALRQTLVAEGLLTDAASAAR